MRRALGFLVGIGLLALAGCSTPNPETGPSPSLPPGLREVDARHSLELKSEVPDDGWVFWAWRNRPSPVGDGEPMNEAITVTFSASPHSEGDFWAGVYMVEPPKDSGGDSLGVRGVVNYHDFTTSGGRVIWGELSSSVGAAAALQGLLVFTERAGTFHAELTVGDGPVIELQQLASGRNVTVRTLPLSAPTQTVPSVGASVSLRELDFGGGFASAWLAADSAPPYAHTLSGDFQLRVPDGRTLASDLSEAIPHEDDSERCMANAGASVQGISAPPVCRQASRFQFGLWSLGAACQPEGSVDAMVNYTTRSAARYVPVLFSVPVDSCAWLSLPPA